MIKLGIMGGTFNPIHNGHLMIARIAASAASLDEVMFLPDGEPPHKSACSLASGISRFNMTALALCGQKGFYASDMEIMRDGTTYTVDTLTELKEKKNECDIYYIVGADTLSHIEQWSRPHLLGDLCSVIAVPRPGIDRDALNVQADHLRKALNLRIILTEESGPDISSTDIRLKITAGQSTAEELPTPVADYIAQHGLYGAPSHSITRQLSLSLSEHRLKHTLSVAETAVMLAVRFGVNPAQAHLAGLLHDCAKGMEAPALLKLIRSCGISADNQELCMPALLHAPAGEALARTQYHVTDSAVLAAIRWHTTGRRNMTLLEKVIYLADMIEPGRRDFPGLSEIRELARKDLDEAVHAAAVQSVTYVTEHGKKLHPRTIDLAREKQ